MFLEGKTTEHPGERLGETLPAFRLRSGVQNETCSERRSRRPRCESHERGHASAGGSGDAHCGGESLRPAWRMVAAFSNILVQTVAELVFSDVQFGHLRHQASLEALPHARNFSAPLRCYEGTRLQ